MTYDGATIYWMSGTGNSFRVASWLGEAARAGGADAALRPIGIGCTPSDDEGGERRLLGLVFPTHGFTAPWPVLRLAWRLPRGRGTHALVMPTRAGTKLGPLFLPGLEGTGGYLVALLLALKGYSVRGVRAVDMPSNFMVAHPGFSRPSAEAIVARARGTVERFIEPVLGGGRRFAGFLSLLLGLVLLPVSVAYLLVGRFFLAKMMFASHKCTGCGQCAEHCPFGAIRMWGKEGGRRPYWTFQCENCLRCMAWCPEQAVESGHSLGVLLYFAASVPVGVYAMNWLVGTLHWPAAIDSVWTRLLLQYPYILLALFVAYLLFTVLARIPLVSRLFAYTTLTHWYRRYHEPGTSLSDLGRRGS